MRKRLLILASMTCILPCLTEAQSSGIDLSAIDSSVSPCQDFYRYACGNWMKQHPIPADKSSWGRGDELRENIRNTLHSILEDAAHHPDGTQPGREIAALYGACMDESRINALGWKPLADEIERIDLIGSVTDLPAEIARLHERSIPVFFSFFSYPDWDNPRQMIAYVDQSGLGLPERDYYFRKDPKSADTRAKYLEHVEQMFELLGDKPESAKTRAQAVMLIETKLAAASLTQTARRDPILLHHPTTLAEFQATVPNFAFSAYLSRLPAPGFQRMNVMVPGFFTAFNSLVASTSLENLKSYLVWQYVHTYAATLSQPFVDADFSFYGKYLSGTPQLKPRWQRCVEPTDRELGEALGQKWTCPPN